MSTAGVIIFGIGLQHDEQICATGIYLCIAFYVTSKMLIYLFLCKNLARIRLHTVESLT